jgi:hypothetical protein
VDLAEELAWGFASKTEGVVALNPDGTFVFSFSSRHAVSSVCAPPCKQCGESNEERGHCWADDITVEVRAFAFFIVREATKQEYLDFCFAYAKNGLDFIDTAGQYFYVVRTD